MELKYNGQHHILELGCEFDSRDYTDGCMPQYTTGDDGYPNHISMWVSVHSAMGQTNLESLLLTADTVVLKSEGWEMGVRHTRPVEAHDSHGLCFRLTGRVVSVSEPSSKLDAILS